MQKIDSLSFLNHLARFTAFFSFLFFIGVSAIQAQELSDDPAVISQGEELFKANCTACHKIDERLVGPALRGVNERRELDWLLRYIKNPQKMISSGDPIAVELYEEYQVVMTAFPFADEQITSILSYIKNAPEEVAAAPVDAGGDGAAVSAEGSVPQAYVDAILIGLVVVLVILLVVLFLIINVLTRFLREKDLDDSEKEIVEQKLDLKALVKSNAFLGIVAFFFTAMVLKTAIDGAFTVGVQQGYEPTQPIAFSHEIHAGQYEIDCQYCHTGVRKSKSANIPSANICMNCHTLVATESPEVQKIYAAVENNTPIEWVRVHNLPDLAYFNHAQHVEVGGLECQTCHGPIEEMAVVRQHSNLTMGWCINCHRETNLNTKGNDYYNKLVELHSEVSKDPMKVEDNGGLECARCHY